MEFRTSLDWIQRMKDEMLIEYGPPTLQIAKGGKAKKKAVLGWSDLYMEEALIYGIKD